jgi:hypothetical protein
LAAKTLGAKPIRYEFDRYCPHKGADLLKVSHWHCANQVWPNRRRWCRVKSSAPSIAGGLTSLEAVTVPITDAPSTPPYWTGDAAQWQCMLKLKQCNIHYNNY